MDHHKVASEIENVTNAGYEEFIGHSEDAVRKQSGANGWSAKEIIGHLIDSASNNHQRWVRMQITERLSFPDYARDNEQWVRVQQYEAHAWASLLDLWRLFNLHMSSIVRGVKKECLQNVWVVDDDTAFTLGELMVDYPRHLSEHLDQIRAVLKR